MSRAAHFVKPSTDNTVEIVVHVNEGLDETQRKALVSALQNTDGITVAEFCPLRDHLLLVRYDTDVLSSQDVLSRVAAQNVHAQLLGPV